jgi:hypothetical protein
LLAPAAARVDAARKNTMIGRQMTTTAYVVHRDTHDERNSGFEFAIDPQPSLDP